MTDTVPRRTAKATERGQQIATEKLVTKLRSRLSLLDDKWLASLAGVLVAECEERGIEVPDLLADDE